MKKDKHILINIEEPTYRKLEDLANRENRSITNYTYLLIIEALKELNK